MYFLANAGGADYVYSTFVQPLLLDHEARIDEAVLQTRAWLAAHVQNNIGWCVPCLHRRMHCHCAQALVRSSGWQCLDTTGCSAHPAMRVAVRMWTPRFWDWAPITASIR